MKVFLQGSPVAMETYVAIMTASCSLINNYGGKYSATIHRD